MYGLVTYLKELYKSCEIPFQVWLNNEIIFRTNPILSSEKNLVENRFYIKNELCIIQTYDRFKDSLKIIKFCIENKYKEEYCSKEKIAISLLKNEYISKEKLEEVMYPLIDTYLITIFLNEKAHELIQLLKNIYSDMDVTIFEYDGYVVLIGVFEEIEEHIFSITETIDVDLYKGCYISYCLIKEYNSISHLYEENICKIELAKKYNLSNRIINEKSMLFESIIDSLSEQSKLKILSKFNNGFNNLDDDTIKTIEVFFNCDLNLSEAAKKLYVHRNTLIYRLDKIKKYTSYDIRSFNEAILFKIAFFIWKGKK